MKTVAVKNIERAEKSIVEGLGTLGVATVHEAQGRIGLLKPYIRPIYRHSRISGSAVTVLVHPGDNWMIHVAVELCLPGDILVVASSAETDSGFFGDLLAESCKAHGILGLIIDAGVRDTHQLEELGFPVWSKGVSSQGTVKAALGAVNVPVVCAGQYVGPGDIVVADDDGVVIVERSAAAKTLDAGIAREKRETAKRRRLADGELGLDIDSMRSRLKDSGLVYLENQEEYSRFDG